MARAFDALHGRERGNAHLDAAAGRDLFEGAQAQPDGGGERGTFWLVSLTSQPREHGLHGGSQLGWVDGFGWHAAHISEGAAALPGVLVYLWAVIRNFAVVGPGQATRERLTAALAAAPNISTYRIGRGADPLPVSATFDPSDQPGCRTLLDWFERGAPSGAVLLVDDWSLCAGYDPELVGTVEWIAAFGPARGVQVVLTARNWADVPDRLRRHLHGEATDFLGLHEIEADLSNKHQRHDLRAAVGGDARGWPVYLDIGADGPNGTYLGPAAVREQRLLAALLGLMITHSSKDLNLGLFDMKNIGVFDGLDTAPHVSFALSGEGDDELFERFQAGLAGELDRRRQLMGHEPLPALLICVDSAEVLIERYPGFQGVLESLTRAGRGLGVHLLYSGDAFPASLPFQLPEWPSAVPPHDLEEWAELLPPMLIGSAPPAHALALPPLHSSHADLTLGMLPPGAIGLVDKPFEQRRDVLVPTFTEELRHGAIVGKPGTGKSTTLRTLAGVLGDPGRYQLLDGPGEPLDPQRHIVVTARTWDQVPPFIRNSLAFAVEFRLDDPATSLVDPGQAARVPDRPGFGLSLPHRLHAQIALP
ncbi:hypothetical protein SAMN04488074_112216 [Lentzea albidocapillata subsp. violacea]|uniref:Uncharacterized protein n=1 Tax=Lentzea albidocapillata subsp. violacea TaxID=128104 RepID=A0A1G9LXP8_9PSEU|nr:hypothetical protein SAMN04488074_112216 [Lentzea albidocapillata subsp. violacea]